MVRPRWPYQFRMSCLVQRVLESANCCLSEGKRAPTRRGRPRRAGERGGAGAYRRASRRSRVIQRCLPGLIDAETPARQKCYPPLRLASASAASAAVGSIVAGPSRVASWVGAFPCGNNVPRAPSWSAPVKPRCVAPREHGPAASDSASASRKLSQNDSGRSGLDPDKYREPESCGPNAVPRCRLDQTAADREGRTAPAANPTRSGSPAVNPKRPDSEPDDNSGIAFLGSDLESAEYSSPSACQEPKSHRSVVPGRAPRCH